ncbi:MAG: ATP-dependent RNA helicase dbp10 [Chrysothrix sp. TS-e1954]|nr:MAG: ATP-dependent RNA helicase dbp10 [Chrysothrix sp. TS-e1954]
MPSRLASPTISESGVDISNALLTDVELHGDPESSLPGSSKASNAKGRSGDRPPLKSHEDSGSDDDEAFIAAQQAASHRRNASAKQGPSRKGGGFQSMGFNPTLLKAITRKGFSIPTPIQRRTVPVVLDGRDVVGMARTGSGKTACFVLPMIEMLKAHSVKVGARAIILSPSRELAIQTLKFVKEFGRGTDLRSILLVGGDSLEDQFGQMTNHPDIIIATPGRFMHLLVEMSLDLSSIRYVVFDEADRLFEAGFAPQLHSLLAALPSSRQTLLFSATLPKSVAEFAKAGLKDPELVRLDAESKISPDLQSAFLTVKSGDKEGALLHLLTDIIKVPFGTSDRKNESVNPKKRKREGSPPQSQNAPKPSSTIIFAATKHHVEYLAQLLGSAGFSASYVYGSLDQTARKAQVERFRDGLTHILVVTDVAARGIDIPMLANVVNYDFPPQPKIFVHRVGRTARAGRTGWSYNIVQSSDMPYLLDLQLFLGRKLVKGHSSQTSGHFADDLVLGAIPPSAIEKHCEWVVNILEDNEDLSLLKSVATKGEKQYLRSRNAASHDSAKRARSLADDEALSQANLLYGSDLPSNAPACDDMLARISSFRPPETIFEFKRRDTTALTEILQKQRQSRRVKQTDDNSHGTEQDDLEGLQADQSQGENLPQVEQTTFSDKSDDETEIVYPSQDTKDNTSKGDEWEDSEYFMSFQPRTGNLAEERAYGVQSGSYDVSKNASFAEAARGVTMDLANDESKGFAEASRPKQRWDKRSKKYVNTANDEDGSKGRKMITSETGQKIAASFRSGRFDAWKKSNRIDRMPRNGEKESSSRTFSSGRTGTKFKHYAERAPKQPDKYRDDYYKKKKKLAEAKTRDANPVVDNRTRKAKSELRNASDVRKQRSVKQKRMEKNARPSRRSKG